MRRRASATWWGGTHASALLLFGGAALVGCSHASSSGPSFDAGTLTSSDQCDRQSAETYVAGIHHTSDDGALQVTITDAVPAPPQGGDNTWTIQVVDARGTPVATPPRVVPLMASRGFVPAATAPTVTPVDGAPGTYKVEHLALGITGAWRVEVHEGADVDGGADHVVAFTFCVET